MREISDAEWNAILDLMGHDPCPGVALRSDLEIRPAGELGPRLYVAIYEPTERAAHPRPAVLGFHGGGYCLGDPHGMGALAKTLALALGVVTVSASYRLGTEESPTGFGILDDAVWAWRYVRSNAVDLGIDPDRIAVAGESAGVLLAGHLAVRSALVEAGMGGGQPAAFYAFWGPLDFVARWYDNGENAGAEVNVLGPGGYEAKPAEYHHLSTLAHARNRALPPALFVYGRNDPVVHARQAKLGVSAWQRAGAHAEQLILPNIGHGYEGDTRVQRRQFLEKAVGFGAARHVG